MDACCMAADTCSAAVAGASENAPCWKKVALDGGQDKAGMSHTHATMFILLAAMCRWVRTCAHLLDGTALDGVERLPKNLIIGSRCAASSLLVAFIVSCL